MTKDKELVVAYEPDTMEDIRRTDLVQLSRKLLDSTVVASDALNVKTFTEPKLKEMKMVLGFLNATNNIIKTKMQYFKMVGLDEKIKAVQKHNKRKK